MENMEKIKSFTQLKAWKEAHLLALLIYQDTKDFPKEEQFGLTSQIRRCAISIPSNIAEGFARGSKKEKIQFYRISKGSLSELQSQLLLARDLGYINKEVFSKTAEQTIQVSRLLTGIIRATK